MSKNKKTKKNQDKKTTNTTKEIKQENKDEITEKLDDKKQVNEEPQKTDENEIEKNNAEVNKEKEDKTDENKVEKNNAEVNKEKEDKKDKSENKEKAETAKKIVAEIEKEKKKTKKMSKEYEKKANKNIFRNIVIAIVILAFCILKILGYMNIREDIFVVDLKVFSISILVFAIILFERSYKSINLTLFTHGLEALFVAIVTLCEVYIYQLFIDKFVMVIAIEALLISVYYIIKCIRIYSKTKKDYIQRLNDISEIVKEEKIIKIETHRKKNKKVKDEQKNKKSKNK